MKQIINLLVVVLIATNLGFSQTTKATKPIKKIVTSKISTDPKTGKVVKTIITTTTTTTDVVLVPGTTVKKTAVAKPKVVTSAPAKKAPVIATKTAVKPKVTTVVKPVVKPAVVASKPAVEVKTEPESIFANPSDHSATNSTVPVNTNATTTVTKTTATTAKTTQKQEPVKTTKKVFKEKGNDFVKSHYGVRGGINLATVAIPNSFTTIANPTDVYKIGGMGGVFYNFAITKMFSVQPEINFSQQGHKISNGIDYDILKNNAMNVPVLLKLTVGENNLKFFVNAGPYAGFLLTSTQSKYIGGYKSEKSIDFATQSSNEISSTRLDYGLQGGAGLQFNLGGPLLEIEGRYNYGLADPLNYPNGKPTYLGETGRNRTLSGSIGIMFPIGK
jgi:Outer membrane protein beta-barrel domain